MSAPIKARPNSRFELLWDFDQTLRQSASKQPTLIGTDEVGRGCIMGPVVAAAYTFKEDFDVTNDYHPLLSWLDDSKASHFTHEKRLMLAEHLKGIGHWAIGEASAQEIDTINIAQASLLACRRAVEALHEELSASSQPCLVLIDGRFTMRGVELPQQAFIKGDAQSASIAAASILAKAHRDSLILNLHETYPQFDWANNKGYPSPKHKQALAEHGPTVHHRFSYKTVSELAQKPPVLQG